MRGVFIVAKVAISRASYSFDALYSYSVPEELAQKVKSGVRVLVPFGRGNRKAVGFVARTYTEAEYNDKLKPVISVVDGESLVTEEMMRIIMWLKENTFCTYMTLTNPLCLQAFPTLFHSITALSIPTLTRIL